MKAKLFGLVASLVLFGVMPGQAASLVDQGNTTYDPNTQLTWLDVNLTTGLSYNYVVSNLLGIGDPYYGYRYATGADVSTLFTNAGISNPYDGVPNGDASAVQTLISLLGATLNNPGHFVETFGITADVAPSTTDLWLAMLRTSASTQIATTQFTHEGPNFTEVDLGSFLVENATSTPLPAALPLFATGLAGMGWLARRRRKQAA